MDSVFVKHGLQVDGPVSNRASGCEGCAVDEQDAIHGDRFVTFVHLPRPRSSHRIILPVTLEHIIHDNGRLVEALVQLGRHQLLPGWVQVHQGLQLKCAGDQREAWTDRTGGHH